MRLEPKNDYAKKDPRQFNTPTDQWESERNCQTVIKIGRKPQMGALFQYRLADWPSILHKTQTETEYVIIS
jgi:hypothetical protein